MEEFLTTPVRIYFITTTITISRTPRPIFSTRMSRRYFNNSTSQNRGIPSSSYGGERQQLRNNGTTGNNNRRLDDSTMIIDAAADETNTSVEDVHVRELRRMFNSCDDDQDGALTTSGLERLCEELRLDDHKEYIISQLLPNTTASRTIGFDSFKLKFIQLLPELVDFSVTERTKPKSGAASPSAGRNNLRVPGK